MRRKKKRVGLVAKVLIAAFAVYAACTLVNLQFRINAAAAEQEVLLSQLEAQKLTCAELADAISGEDQEEYIARIARDSLGYIYPGEQDIIQCCTRMEAIVAFLCLELIKALNRESFLIGNRISVRSKYHAYCRIVLKL